MQILVTPYNADTLIEELDSTPNTHLDSKPLLERMRNGNESIGLTLCGVLQLLKKHARYCDIINTDSLLDLMRIAEDKPEEWVEDNIFLADDLLTNLNTLQEIPLDYAMTIINTLFHK